jgi:Tfp pilus assembly protein FimT
MLRSVNCWESGWLLFVDDNSSGTIGVRDSNEEIIRVSSFDRPQHLWKATQYSNAITYLPTGAVTQAGMFTYCIDWNGDGDYTDQVDARNWRAVIINLAGRPRLAVDDDTPPDGVFDDANGNDLTCP